MRTKPRLFLDASVWIAGAGSRTGASALVLDLCRQGLAVAITSRLILVEAERNIRRKLDRDALLHFYRDIATLELDLVDAPSAAAVAAQERIIRAKDAHVIAAALKGAIQVLLTLDRRHFLVPPVLKAGLPFEIMTPGDFVRRFVQDRG